MTDPEKYSWVLADSDNKVLMAWDNDEKLVFPNGAAVSLTAKGVIAAIRQIQGNIRRDFFGPYDYAGTHEVAEFLGVRKQVVSNHAAPTPGLPTACGPSSYGSDLPALRHP